jgi:hypothetical protein
MLSSSNVRRDKRWVILIDLKYPPAFEGYIEVHCTNDNDKKRQYMIPISWASSGHAFGSDNCLALSSLGDRLKSVNKSYTALKSSSVTVVLYETFQLLHDMIIL